MPAYVISEFEVRDEEALQAYVEYSKASIADHGGRYLVLGAPIEVVEGDPTKRRIVIVEFPSMERAQEWYASPAYAKALQFRDKALDRRVTLVDGDAPVTGF